MNRDEAVKLSEQLVGAYVAEHGTGRDEHPLDAAIVTIRATEIYADELMAQDKEAERIAIRMGVTAALMLSCLALGILTNLLTGNFWLSVALWFAVGYLIRNELMG